MKRVIFAWFFVLVCACGANQVWLDEGIRLKKTLRKNTENPTFCFQSNSTLRIRVDALKNPSQPYIVQFIGRFKYAVTFYELLVSWLTKLEEYASPFRHFLWAWSDLRVIVSSPQLAQLKFYYHYSPSYFCRVLSFINNNSHALKDFVNFPYFDMAMDSALQIPNLFCHSCGVSKEGCEISCLPLSSDSCLIAISPYQDPCITVSAVSSNGIFLSPMDEEYPFTFSFFTVISLSFSQNLMVGSFFFLASHKLSRSRSFHYLLGAFSGIFMSIVLALYVIFRYTRSTMHSVPGMRLFEGGSTILTLIYPLTGVFFMSTIMKLLEWAIEVLYYFWISESVMGIPHLGKAYFFIFGSIGMLLVWWNQWGAFLPMSEENDMDISIDNDNDFPLIDYDDIPSTATQNMLSRILKFVGVYYLFQSTSILEMSFLVVVIILSIPLFHSVVLYVYFFWLHYEKVGRSSSLISVEEYKSQGSDSTKKALEELQKYYALNPKAWEKVKEESEVRVRRFAHGRNHMETDISTNVFNNRKKKTSIRQWCSIQ